MQHYLGWALELASGIYNMDKKNCDMVHCSIVANHAFVQLVLGLYANTHCRLVCLEGGRLESIIIAKEAEHEKKVTNVMLVEVKTAMVSHQKKSKRSLQT